MSTSNGFVDKTKFGWCGVCGCAHYAHSEPTPPPILDPAPNVAMSPRNGTACPHCNCLHRHDLGCPKHRDPVQQSVPDPPVTPDPAPNVAPEPRQTPSRSGLGHGREVMNDLPGPGSVGCVDCGCPTTNERCFRCHCDAQPDHPYSTPEVYRKDLSWCDRCAAAREIGHECWPRRKA